MKGNIIFLTGGARSGKSSFALNEASKINGKKAYIATAEALDDEMRGRIEKHKKDRPHEWDTYEEPLKISSVLSGIKDKYSVVIIDCLTLWLSNILTRAPSTMPNKPAGPEESGSPLRYDKQDTEQSIREFIEELEALKKSSIVNRSLASRRSSGPRAKPTGQSSIFIVSNEIGMGIVPENELAREFRDWAGLLNQKVAETADEVYLIMAGIPMKIK